MNNMKYDEKCLIEDIKETLQSEDNYRIKIACIESYFNVYERFQKPLDCNTAAN